VTSNDWSVVDAASDPRRLVTGLDALRAEPFFAHSKARMAARIESWQPARLLDIGCGTGEDAVALPGIAMGIERSTVMCREARVRHPDLALIAGDALCLPISDSSVNAVRADRVLQHLPDGPGALREWRRVLRPSGHLVCFDPDLTTATVDGVDTRFAEIILNWRHGTRPGAATVRDLPASLRAAGFSDVAVETATLDLADLDQADGIMGLATWGHGAAAAGALSRVDARRWTDDVQSAASNGTLRYRCRYLLAEAKRSIG
jgi:SAM-dependent methyltransferase